MIGHWSRLLVLASALTVAASPAFACNAKVLKQAHVIGFIGCISQASADALIQAMSPDARTLIIQSEGGAVWEAVRIANRLAETGITLFVRGYCSSSCANYLLPSADATFLEAGAAATFHGDAQTTIDRASDETRAMVYGRLATEFGAIVAAERQLQEAHPRAMLVHLAQRIAFATKDATVQARFYGKTWRCPGIDQIRWVASADALQRMALIDGVVAPLPYFQRDIPLAGESPGEIPSSAFLEPLLGCASSD